MSRDNKLPAWLQSAPSSPLQPSVKVCPTLIPYRISITTQIKRQLSINTREQRSASEANPFPADLVQDLYLRELRAYKAPTIKATDAEGHVQKFAAPKAPKSPEEADIANELKSYEASAVEIEGQGEPGAPASTEFEWFEEEPEEEEAKH